MWRLHGSPRRRRSPLLHHFCFRSRRKIHHYHRRPRTVWPPPSGSAGLPRRRSFSVRLLYLRHDHKQRRPASTKSESVTRRNHAVTAGQHLPLRRSPAHRRGRRKRRQSRTGASLMSPAGKFPFEAEPERYELRSPSLHQFAVARRDFFRILGTGIAIFAVSKNALAIQETAPG